MEEEEDEYEQNKDDFGENNKGTKDDYKKRYKASNGKDVNSDEEDSL